MPKPIATPVVEQRAPDQPAALEAAFEAGALPEEDRRTHVLVPRETLTTIAALIAAAQGETGYSATALLTQAAQALAALTV